ncbi:g5336 [Coccomyxa elongata]
MEISKSMLAQAQIKPALLVQARDTAVDELAADAARQLASTQDKTSAQIAADQQGLLDRLSAQMQALPNPSAGQQNKYAVIEAELGIPRPPPPGDPNDPWLATSAAALWEYGPPALAEPMQSVAVPESVAAAPQQAAAAPGKAAAVRKGEAFQLGEDPWTLLRKVEREAPMADWRQILEPRVIDSGCKITIEMLVRAFAEQPSTSLNSQERGPRLTAHLVCWLTNQVRRLSDELRYAHSQLAATNTRLERAQQTIKEHKAEWVSAHQQIKRQMSALEHKLARHLNAKANAPQSQAQPQPESVEAEPELSAKLAGDDAWTLFDYFFTLNPTRLSAQADSTYSSSYVAPSAPGCA